MEWGLFRRLGSMLRARELREGTVGSIPLDMVPGYSGVFPPWQGPGGPGKKQVAQTA